MSLHSEDAGPPKQTRQVFAVSSRGGQIMRVDKTRQDFIPRMYAELTQGVKALRTFHGQMMEDHDG